MRQSEILRTKSLFSGSAAVRRFTFKAVDTRDSYAHFAGINYHLSMEIGDSRDNCAILQDCFECLSPHKIAA